MKVVKLNTTVTRVTYSPTHGGHKSFMLLSDIHWDNPHCDRVLLKKHLDLAKERQAGVFVFGDLFCAIRAGAVGAGGGAALKEKPPAAHCRRGLKVAYIQELAAS